MTKPGSHAWKPETISAFQARDKKTKKMKGEKAAPKPKPCKMPRSMEEKLKKMTDTAQWVNPICDSSRGVYNWRKLRDDPQESLFARCKRELLEAEMEAAYKEAEAVNG